MTLLSLIGVLLAVSGSVLAWAFVPLNICYWYTAARGWRNTR
jgi:cytochrome b subunit of formate dehydrogenase